MLPRMFRRLQQFAKPTGSRLRLTYLEERVTPMAGQLDPSFGVGGLVTTRMPIPSYDYAQATAIDSIGRIVVAGYTDNGAHETFVVCRYSSSGALDSTFGNAGVVTVALGVSNDYAYGVAIDSLNRIVVAGSTESDALSVYDPDFAVVRLTETGTLDNTFDGDGKVTITFGTGEEQARAVALDSLGRIVIAGYSHNGTNFDFALARLTSTGALDSSFDGDGKQTIAFGTGDDKAFGVAVDSADRVIAVGYTDNGTSKDFAIARLIANGTLDTTFDGDGKLATAMGSYNDEANGVAIDSADRILVAGFRQVKVFSSYVNEYAIARLTTSGAFDPSFSSDGKLTFSANAVANSLTVDSMDRPVIAGSVGVYETSNFGVYRLNVSGEVDIGQTLDFGGSYDAAYGVTVDWQDRIVAAGVMNTSTGFDFALARLTAGGTLDASFNGDGKKTHDLMARSYAWGHSVGIDSLGRTVVAGDSPGTDGYNHFAVARYTAAGDLDVSFGGSGYVNTGFGTFGQGVAIDSLNRILVVGVQGNGCAVARITAAGVIDTSFGVNGQYSDQVGMRATAVTVDSFDRVIVVGYRYFDSENSDFAVARLTTSGNLDTGFASAGSRVFSLGGRDDANGVAIDSQGRIVIAGFTTTGSNTDFTIVRLLTNGSFDPSFDGDGIQTVDFGSTLDNAYGVAIDSGDRIVVAGYSYGSSATYFATARINTNGALDVTFDTDGRKTLDLGTKNGLRAGVAVDSQDRVVLVGDVGELPDINYGVVRLSTAGALDTTFDTDGFQAVVFGPGLDRAYGVTVDVHDRVVISGSADVNGRVFALARLTGDTPPAKLASITVNDGSAQRSMVTSLKIAFDSKVSFTGSPASAFQLNRQSDNAPLTLSAAVDVSSTFVTLTFTGGAVNGSSVADGRYTLKILASQFGGLGFDGNGNGLANLSPADDYVQIGSPTSTNKLFRLFGDSDGDGSVAANDFIQFRLALGGNSVIFDFDGDGSVAASDFIQFRLRFGGSI